MCRVPFIICLILALHCNQFAKNAKGGKNHVDRQPVDSSTIRVKVEDLVKKKSKAYLYHNEEKLRELVRIVMESLDSRNIKIFNPETKIIDEKALNSAIEEFFKDNDIKKILNQNLRVKSNYHHIPSHWHLIKNELVIKINSEIGEEEILSLILKVTGLGIGVVPVFANSKSVLDISFENEMRIDLTQVKDKIEAVNKIETVLREQGFLINKDSNRSIWKIHR